MSGGTAGDVDFGPDAVLIEIFGCINIFAPPEIQKIGGAGGAGGAGGY
jgi:hypothetical protein